MKKTIFTIVAVLLAVLMFAGCSQTSTPASSAAASTSAAAATSASPASASATQAASASSAASAASQGKQLNITFVSPVIGMPVWLNAKYGADAAGKQYNAQVSWVGPATIDMNAQVNDVEQAIAAKVDGIICCPLSPSIFEDVYKKAMAAGIAVINTAVDSPEDTRNAYIGTDYTNFGQQAAKNLADKLGGKGNIAVLVTSMDSANQIAEEKAGEEYWAKNNPDMKVIVTETTNSDTATATDKVNALLSTYSELNAIWCLESASPLAAGQSVQERGLSSKITILGH